MPVPFIPTSFDQLKPPARYLRGQLIDSSAEYIFSYHENKQKKQAGQPQPQPLQPGAQTARPAPRIRGASDALVCQSCGTFTASGADALAAHRATCAGPRHQDLCASARPCSPRQLPQTLPSTVRPPRSARSCEGRVRRPVNGGEDVTEETLARAMRDNRIAEDAADADGGSSAPAPRLHFMLGAEGRPYHKLLKKTARGPLFLGPASPYSSRPLPSLNKVLTRFDPPPQEVQAALHPTQPRIADIVIGEIVDPDDPVRKHGPPVSTRAHPPAPSPRHPPPQRLRPARALRRASPCTAPSAGATCPGTPSWGSTQGKSS